ncbi:polyprenyl synthetase family protein, partial [Haemophilus influenzae]|uniref:polyprenyl synthetase family protein n=1 Tax=Haemophilus influenzae TaxID=727 RepID=UPI0018E3446C
KNVGDDLNEGKPTLPLLHAMHHGTPEQAQMIRTAIEQGNGRHLLEPVLEAMNVCLRLPRSVPGILAGCTPEEEKRPAGLWALSRHCFSS